MLGMKVVVLFNVYDVKGLMIQVICDDNLIIFCYYKGIMGLLWMFYFEGSMNVVLEEVYMIFFGQVCVVCEGCDVIIVMFLQMVQKLLLVVE